MARAFSTAQISVEGNDAESQLQKARDALTGPNKSPEQAKNILLELVDSRTAELRRGSLCYAYVYLGYIADRAGDRGEAVAWFTKAAAIPDAAPGLIAVVREGIQRPVTWIRHLDDADARPRTEQPAPGNNAATTLPRANPGGGTTSEPSRFASARTLSAEQRLENLDFLWNAADQNYGGFALKSIDWQAVHARYLERLKSVNTDDEFYALLFQLVNELKDAGSCIDNWRPPHPRYAPGVSIDLFDGKPYIVAVNPNSSAATAGAKTGSEIVAIDGSGVDVKIEQMRAYLNAQSSERAYRREASWWLLAGARGSTVSVKLRSPDGGTQTVLLARDSFQPVQDRPSRNLGFNLTRQRFVHFGRHPSGLGYIWIESFDAYEEIGDELGRALEALRSAPGLILDVRDNLGGYLQARLAGRFVTSRKLGAVRYTKKGPGHKDFATSKIYLQPSGKWQYKGPVALLINDVTGRATDMFTNYMKSVKGVTTIGSTTHGNASGGTVRAVLPCGLEVQISNGYFCDAKGRPIEGNGNEPDIAVSPGIADFLAGKDPVLDKAVEFLTTKSKP